MPAIRVLAPLCIIIVGDNPSHPGKYFLIVRLPMRNHERLSMSMKINIVTDNTREVSISVSDIDGRYEDFHCQMTLGAASMAGPETVTQVVVGAAAPVTSPLHHPNAKIQGIKLVVQPVPNGWYDDDVEAFGSGRVWVEPPDYPNPRRVRDPSEDPDEDDEDDEEDDDPHQEKYLSWADYPHEIDPDLVQEHEIP